MRKIVCNLIAVITMLFFVMFAAMSGCSGSSTSDSSSSGVANGNKSTPGNVRWTGKDSGYRSDERK